MRIKNFKAFSLLETLNSVAIFSVLFVLIIGIFAAGDRLWLLVDANASNQKEARRAIIDMERKIRGATDFTLLSSNAVSFTLNGETVTYSLVAQAQGIKYACKGSSCPKNYYIKETTGNQTRRIANDIKSLQFSLDTSDKYPKVVIDIEAEKDTLRGQTVSFTLKQTATLRNS